MNRRSHTAVPPEPGRGRPGAGRSGSGRAVSLDGRMLGFDPRALWTALKAESPAFWCLCAYLMVEYVRPQSVWRAIDVLPYGKLTLGLTVVAYVLGNHRPRPLHLMDWLLGAFSLVVLLSSVFAVYPGYAFDDLITYVNWVLLYFLVTRIVRTPRSLFLFVGFFLLWSLKMSQHGTRIFIGRGFSFSSWGATGAPGWFQNSGEFAVQMCILLPLSLHVILAVRDRLKRWQFYGLLLLLPGTAVISLLASSSRGGQVAGAVVGLFLVLQTRFRPRELLTAAVLLTALWFGMPEEQRARFESMGDDETSQTRLTYWRHGLEMMNDYPIFGVGYDNWIPYYHTRYSPTGQVSHNIFIEAGSQLGYLGLASLLLLIGGTFRLNRLTRRRAEGIPVWGRYLGGLALGLDGALVGFMAAGFFVTVLFYPFLWVNLALTAALYQIARRRASRARAPGRRVAGRGGGRAPTRAAVGGEAWAAP